MARLISGMIMTRLKASSTPPIATSKAVAMPRWPAKAENSRKKSRRLAITDMLGCRFVILESVVIGVSPYDFGAARRRAEPKQITGVEQIGQTRLFLPQKSLWVRRDREAGD